MTEYWLVNIFLIVGIVAWSAVTYLVVESFRAKRTVEDPHPEIYLIPTQGPIGPPTRGSGPKVH